MWLPSKWQNWYYKFDLGEELSNVNKTSTRQTKKGSTSTRHTVQICMRWKLSITPTLLCVSTPALHVLTCKSLYTSSTSTQVAPPGGETLLILLVFIWNNGFWPNLICVTKICRNQSAKHYRHRASPDCNTVASFDSSSSESRNGGLNRYYRQAWQNLHESTSIGPKSSNHSPLRRKETMDEPYRKEGTERTRDTSEMVVSDGARGGGEKKRHHHHHHHHKEWNRPPKRYWQPCMVITVQFEGWFLCRVTGLFFFFLSLLEVLSCIYV